MPFPPFFISQGTHKPHGPQAFFPSPFLGGSWHDLQNIVLSNLYLFLEPFILLALPNIESLMSLRDAFSISSPSAVTEPPHTIICILLCLNSWYRCIAC